MKRALFVIAMIACVACGAQAQGRGFGLGIIMGEPTGLSAKGWVSSRGAIDAGLAWSFRGQGFLHAHMDYLWHFQDVINTRHQLMPYVGLGGRIWGNNGRAIAGLRVAGGLSWLPADTPLDVFVEIAPVVDLTPETEASVNGGVGIRFYFR
jgi:hypothetical protein